MRKIPRACAGRFRTAATVETMYPRLVGKLPSAREHKEQWTCDKPILSRSCGGGFTFPTETPRQLYALELWRHTVI